MRDGDTPEGASPKGLGWPLHREKKKNLNEMKSSIYLYTLLNSLFCYYLFSL